MKTYSELSETDQKKAINFHANELLKGMIEGAFRFDDEANEDDLQTRIDQALNKADEMQTPWFAHEYIMDTCKFEVMNVATASAENAFYAEEGENVVTHYELAKTEI